MAPIFRVFLSAIGFFILTELGSGTGITKSLMNMISKGLTLFL